MRCVYVIKSICSLPIPHQGNKKQLHSLYPTEVLSCYEYNNQNPGPGRKFSAHHWAHLFRKSRFGASAHWLLPWELSVSVVSSAGSQLGGPGQYAFASDLSTDKISEPMKQEISEVRLKWLKARKKNTKTPQARRASWCSKDQYSTTQWIWWS